MQFILTMVDYDKHKWRVCCDLKVVAMLCGLQGGYTKHMCFLCDWDTRYKGNQYRAHHWKDRQEPVIGEHNVDKEALVPRESILIPLLHTKLGVVKNLIMAVAYFDKKTPENVKEHRKEVFNVLKTIFPKISDAKLMKGK